jgi:shikimate dehydrogenase
MVAHRLAVMGNPIAHSRSPEIHEALARQTGIALGYDRILVAQGEFRTTSLRFLETGGLGFNVTVPCKGDAYEFADQCSDSADRCEAVNTISVGNDGLIHGDNTDGPGLVRDLTGNLAWKIEGQRVLVLGAGGAVRGVLWDLLHASPESIHLNNRTMTKAESIVDKMNDDRLVAVRQDELSENYDLIINGTSAGLNGDIPDLPTRVLGSKTCCYDMVYGSSATSFNAWCRNTAKCEIADGLGMLVEQAALSFKIWFSEFIDADLINTAEIISSLRKKL